MSDRYYIVLTTGSYSDYGISGLYYSDHAVDQTEFDQLAHEYSLEVDRKWKEFSIGRLGKSVRDFDEEDNKNYLKVIQWCEENNPEKLFVKKHNLIVVDYQEFNY